jgi:hypothetical protein
MKPLLFACGLVFAASGAMAQSVKLTADQIVELLSGNTAVGTWEGAQYRQYFASDGSTIYAQPQARSILGQWRVDADRDEYQNHLAAR